MGQNQDVSRWLGFVLGVIVVLSVFFESRLLYVAIILIICFLIARGLYFLPRLVFSNLQPETAIILTTRLLKLLPENSVLLKHRAQSYSSIQKYPSALADMKQVLEKQPDDLHALFLRQFIHIARYDYEAALADAERIHEIKPEDTFLDLCRGLSLQKSGFLDEAMATYDGLYKKLGPDDPLDVNQNIQVQLAYLHGFRGILYRELGELEKAEREIWLINENMIRQKTMRDNISRLKTTGLGLIALLRNEFPKAEEYFQITLDIPPDDKHAVVGMAIVEYLTDRQGEAKRRWKTLKSERPEYGDGEWVAAELALPDDLAKVVIEIAES